MTAAKPRVGINLCSIRPRQLSGPSIYAERLTEQLLDQKEFEWVIYCHKELDLPASWAARAQIRRVITTLRRPMRVAFEQIRLPLIARREKIDLLFSPNFVSPIWGGRMRVATIHDMYYRVIPYALPPWQRRYWEVFIPFTARHCDRLIAVSKSTARDIAKHLPLAANKTRVTHLACAVEDMHAPDAAVPGIEPGFILWVANVVAHKNPQAVVEALAHLNAKGQRMQVVHVGSDEHADLNAAIEAAGCADQFKRVGRIPAAQLRWLYHNALCVIQPSIYEGFGIPVLEAQAFGAPLICSSAGPLPEVAGDGALYFEPRDSRRLAEHIEQVAHNPGLRASLSAKGVENSASFTWERTARATMDVFRELLGGNPVTAQS
jgi:glycosyltransferase involved in cell wall biosynthesis